MTQELEDKEFVRQRSSTAKVSAGKGAITRYRIGTQWIWLSDWQNTPDLAWADARRRIEEQAK